MNNTPNRKRVARVTGACSGIGPATARQPAAAGCSVDGTSRPGAAAGQVLHKQFGVA